MKPKEYALALYKALRGKSKAEVDAGVQRFVGALRRRGAVRLLPRILEALPAAVYAARADSRVTITSAVELSEGERSAVVQALGLEPSATDVETVVDPAAIGGLKVKSAAGTKDATVRAKLARLKQALAQAA